MKSRLLSLLLLYPMVFYGLSQQEIDEIALKAEPLVTQYDYNKPTGEMKIRNFLKENYPDLKTRADIDSIMRLVGQLKENPSLINKLEKKDSQAAPSNGTQSSDGSMSELFDEETKKLSSKGVALAREAKLIWDKNGNMGEFAARRFLKDEKGVTSKKVLDAIVKEIVKLGAPKVPGQGPLRDRDDSGSQQKPAVVQVSADVEKWAQKFKNFDPQTQRFKLLKSLGENNVDKVLWNPIMIRISALRSESSFVSSGAETPAGSTESRKTSVDNREEISSASSSKPSSGKSREEQNFDSIVTSPEIKQMRSLFENNERAFIQFIQIMRFKINNSMNMLWQDLAAYFDLTTLERPSNRTEQILYDWVLTHNMNDVYKYDEV